MIAYPDPPWHTHGRAYITPYLVHARDITVPAPLEVEARFGRCLGLLAYIVYETPSPLTYGELIWIPCLVRAKARDGRTVRGFYVDKMYVDLEASLRAGREIWALPKQLATFEETGSRVRVSTEDGARLELEVGTRPLAANARSQTATLQVRDGKVIRFVGKATRAKTSAGFIRVSAAEGTERFMGFANATRIKGAGIALVPFETTMCPPEIVT